MSDLSDAPGRTAPTVGDGDAPSRLRRRLEVLTGVAFSEGNRVEVLRNGDEIFPAMLEAISAAQSTVDLMTFVYWRGDIAVRFAKALAERAQAGIRVRLLVDALGGRLIETDLWQLMRDAGVQVEWFRKPILVSPFKSNHRLHRKVCVVDGTVGFVGGVGIAEEWCGDARDEREWRDTHLRVRGPAVDGLRAAFTQDWGETGRGLYDDRDGFDPQPALGDVPVQILRGSASLGWDDLQACLFALLCEARTRLRIASAYFAPDRAFLDLLCHTARRGVQVQMLLPGPHADKRVCQLTSESDYQELLAAGVEIYLFQPSMMHQKVITLDGVLSVVGSSNFNRRSFDHDEEVVAVLIDDDLTAQLDANLDNDFSRSRLVLPGEWQQRSLGQRALEAATTPLRRWM